MDIPLVSLSAHTVQTLAFASLVIVFLALFPTLSSQWKLFKIPQFGTPKYGETQHNFFLQHATDIYREGYKKFTNSVYRIASGGGTEVVVVPPKFLPELRKYSDDVLSNRAAVNKVFEVAYLNHEPIDTPLLQNVKSDLIPALGRVHDRVADEVSPALERVLPPCNEWTKISVYSDLAAIISQVSGRIIVGPEIGRDPEYIDHSVNFTNEFMGAVTAVKSSHPWLRLFKATRLTEARRLRDRTQRVINYFGPIIEQRLQAEQKPDDMLQWQINRNQSSAHPEDSAALSKRVLTLIFASIHTTSSTITNALFSLAAFPEYIEPLREEIRSVTAAHGGKLTQQALQKLVKMDSFMKEVVRLHPTNITSFQRLVLKPLTLSNGQYIPAGVIIEVAADAANHDNLLHPNPDNFDGFRFYKLRQSASSSELARSQFVSSNERDLFFGYGNHACPGRFFAAVEIKLILARFLLDYDMKMPDGLTERYESIRHERFLGPDPTKQILLKRVH